MFKRSLNHQARQFSTRRPFTAPQCLVPPPMAALRQQQRIVLPYNTLRRVYSSDAAEKKDEKKEETQKEAKPVDQAKLTEEMEKLKKELDSTKNEAKDFKDKFLRAVADFRNFQDRAERDKKAARDFAIQKFAKDLVDSVDNLDRALTAVPEESRTNAEKNKELVDFYNGLKMTEKILLNTLKKHGLEKVHPVGEEFDPNRHEATFQVPMPDKEPNTVFHVQQTGFMLNGRTIRAAKVGVVAAPASA